MWLCSRLSWKHYSHFSIISHCLRYCWGSKTLTVCQVWYHCIFQTRRTPFFYCLCLGGLEFEIVETDYMMRKHHPFRYYWNRMRGGSSDTTDYLHHRRHRHDHHRYQRRRKKSVHFHIPNNKNKDKSSTQPPIDSTQGAYLHMQASPSKQTVKDVRLKRAISHTCRTCLFRWEPSVFNTWCCGNGWAHITFQHTTLNVSCTGNQSNLFRNFR